MVFPVVMYGCESWLVCDEDTAVKMYQTPQNIQAAHTTHCVYAHTTPLVHIHNGI